MTKEQFKKGFISGVPYFAAAAMQVPFVLDGDVGVNGVMMAANFGIGAVLFYLKCKRFSFLNTAEYKEYVAVYNEFVSDIAKMYKELGFKGDFSTSVVYKHCLESGIFSVEPVEYTLYYDDKDDVYRYCGGRVATGKCCCRHNASLLADVLTEMGGVAPKVSVYLGEETNEKNIYRANHLVTGTLLNDKRLIVDPTVGLVDFWNHGAYLFDREYSGKMTTVKSLDDTRFYLLDPVYAKETDKGRSYKEFMKHDSDISSEELADSFFDGTMNACRYNDDFITFHHDEKKKILQLARLSSVVAPHGKVKE